MKNNILRPPAIIICHGKSEKMIADYLKSSLKIPIIIESEKNGSNSIQVGKSLERFLNNAKLKNYTGFQNYYDTIEMKKKYPQNLKIFPIMDLDDATDKVIMEYKNRQAFSSHWLKKEIIPIYNENNLENVLQKMKYPYETKSNKKVAKYLEVFPKNRGEQDIDAIKQFLEDCRCCKHTNMDEMIEYLIKYAQEHRTM
ncbi:hypothetical protein QJS77_05610 [Enterococcus faecium]|uniref:hypothetical protein n=1 Tax=Enterococcus faecium TaxID=1352 RepID=UPI0002A291A7|nr:hypothetical protein [Enterococcus faecium]EGP5070748.1 hypothetical protein [Enterococcus faecium]ELA97245.1 hypothetical protein OI9_03621 [Enterococcus faecium EnGen0001]EME7084291.1 hypothetical protein [Enterococcus faecium]EME7161953.1 hypothetical protein [Enterococcus faecium]MBE9904614.1 hypothetical protein [Enterococcus faecium]